MVTTTALGPVPGLSDCVVVCYVEKEEFHLVCCFHLVLKWEALRLLALVLDRNWFKIRSRFLVG